MPFVPEPLALPWALTLGAIPLTYSLGLISGNVSWVDRAWPFYPVICSTLVVVWAYNHRLEQYSGALPRLLCMAGLQYVWSARLTRHAIKRGFYDLTGEDYRYTEFRKLVPSWFFQLIHIFVIAIAQPLLLFSLAIPLYSTLKLSTTGPSTGLNSMDLFLVISGLSLVYLEHKADSAMYAYQTAKHASKSTDIVKPTKTQTDSTIGPKPASYPREFHPGFIVSNLFRYSRHPNFAAEQLFWVNQTLFAVNAGLASKIPRDEWLAFGPIFGPCFALSLLFCSSTFLTEWITSRKYPTYHAYKGLVGQFLPQETLWVQLWSVIRGRKQEYFKSVYTPPSSSE
ncbi:hypothetical protein DB88DRAFT_496946 [Papiliotrema laurentii]|uniref:Steroid 5-alpha reductase C-terminal domain-containing protein n=1 Tax=Papiliotrema laurentii TaxID=5418 RepID=A0AAD9FP15_PAPLA|nr:hypothetical protein DB88DRAFT_496946 [Papiliotrema laurentii]